MASVNWMHEAGHSKPLLSDNTERWSGKAGGMGVQDWGTHVHSRLIHVDVWQIRPQYCKAIILKLSQFSSVAQLCLTLCNPRGVLVIKKEVLPYATTWIDLDGIMLSEISQRKTDIV